MEAVELPKLQVFRDPIYDTLIELHYFEILIINTRIFQRLRRLLQTPSVAFVFPSATHTRFAHSIGSLHIATLYADSITKIRSDPRRRELLRLAALLHDIGHGIFSHLYDDVVYPDIYPDTSTLRGHDAHRHKILTEYMPQILQDRFNECSKFEQKRIQSELEQWKFIEAGKRITADVFAEILKQVSEIWKGESARSVDFNIIQGPLGADRIDYLLRDSYFTGVPYGKTQFDRIIRFSDIAKDQVQGQERLCYAQKTFDDIWAFLVNRFLMYNNVYFHKTARAVDCMLKEALDLLKNPLELKRRTETLPEFEFLDDYAFFRLGLELKKEEPNIKEGQRIIKELLNRKLFKKVYERYMKVPPDFSEDAKAALGTHLDRKIKFIKDTYLEKTGRNLECKFYKDTPYELTFLNLEELTGKDVYLYKDSTHEVISFDNYRKKIGYDPFLEPEPLRLVRLYTSDKAREELQGLGIIPLPPESSSVDTKF